MATVKQPKTPKNSPVIGSKLPVAGIANPVCNVIRVPISQVVPNNYNPNSQQSQEIHLLYVSILEDGYTQPVVCIFNDETKMYEIVDGFHRYRVMKEFHDIYEANEGLLPIVVIKTSINDKMASTVRHNRARGKHSAVGMTNIVSEMLKNGATKEEIQSSLGMSDEEYKRLIVSNGILSLYENVDYSMSWLTKKQVMIKTQHVKNN